MKPQANYCSVARAYEIADSCMFEQFIAHAVCTPEGWRREDEPANEAARWLLARGMARLAGGGLIELVDLPASEVE